MKVIVAGSRDFNDYALLASRLDFYLSKQPDVTIISGGARGADTLGERYAKSHNLKLDVYPANWDRFGKSAGYRRNVQMAEVADACVVFWNGTSKGSKHMIDIAIKHNLKLRIVKY